MIIIEHSLLPTIDESQRIAAGPIIAYLVQKVPPQRNYRTNSRQVEKFNLIYQHY